MSYIDPHLYVNIDIIDTSGVDGCVGGCMKALHIIGTSAKKLGHWVDGWMGGWMGGWMNGSQSRVKDCLQQLKIIYR